MHGKFGMIISDSESNPSLVNHGHGKQPHYGIFESEQSGNKWSAGEQLGINQSNDEQSGSEKSDGKFGSEEVAK